MPQENITDFYTRGNEHGQYNPNIIDISTSVDLIVSKIEMIIFTSRGEVMGDYDFGADLEFYLYQTQVDATFIEDRIKTQIEKYIPEMTSIPYTLTSEFIKGDITSSTDALLIQVFVEEQQISAFFYDKTGGRRV